MSVIPPPPGPPGPGPLVPSVRVGALGDAWRFLRSDVRGWLNSAGILIILVGIGNYLLGLISRPISSVTLGLSSVVLMALALIPYTLLFAGLMRRALSQARGVVLPPKSIFSLEGRGKDVARYAVYIAAVSLITGVLTTVTGLGLVAILGSAGNLVKPLAALVIGLAGMAVQSVLGLGLPMVFDENLSAGQAFSKAFSTFKPYFWAVWGMMILSVLCAGIGLICCIVGVFFTFSFAAITPAVIYNDFFPRAAAPTDPLGYASYPRPPQ